MPDVNLFSHQETLISLHFKQDEWIEICFLQFINYNYSLAYEELGLNYAYSVGYKICSEFLRA